MELFKFGGASVKDAESVKNVVNVLRKTGAKNKVVVISAMGKTTNMLETLIGNYFNDKPALTESILVVKECHWKIADELFSENHPVFKKINEYFDDLNNFLEHNKSPNYDYVYDQIIGFGELLSTTIVSEYLLSEGIENTWADVRNLIKTDDTYRDAKVNWEQTQENITRAIDPNKLTITQGFIASDENNFSTSLGREGSDYSAAIFAYCLNAKSLSIWKDVEGVLNGDPKVFENTRLLELISYEEAIELAFYGASVIHPKTLQPLQKKEIPLFVKSFYEPENPGTSVCKGQPIFPEIPCFIVKKNLLLISLSSLDFSFIVEKNISEIFALFDQYQIKVDLIQNSAISFSVCVENKFNTIEKLITHLKANYKVSYNENVSLYTIRHFTEKAIGELEKGKTILLKQLTQKTVQLVTKE
ncbi:MAG TPA: aspartate kinase [Flavobacteriaceae bacterium]|nr:aspartate kinase [Flavobacteriaceae bacterium]